MKKLLLAALAVLCGAQVASGAADQVRDGSAFNTPDCHWKFVVRTVDSTGTKAGRRDSFVVECVPPKMPTPITVGGMDDTDTSSVVFRFDANKSLKISEQSKDRDQSFTLSNVIAAGALAGTSTLAAAGADSSAVLDTRYMRLGMLVIKCVPVGGGAGLITRLAISVRTHVNGVSDSVMTAPIYLYGNAPIMVATTAVADTSGQGHLFTGSAAVPWSGEFVVTANGVRNAPASAVAATAFSYPNAICIPLTNLWGREIYSPWTSIRVRNVTGPACQVYVSLVGTPL